MFTLPRIIICKYILLLCMRFLTADYLYPLNIKPIQKGVLQISPKGEIIDVFPDRKLVPKKMLEIFDGILCPGFINAHCHLELSHLKGFSKKHNGLLDFIKKITNSNRSDHKDVTYTLGKHELLDTWATTQFPNLMYKQTYAQLQKPGEQVLPHVDTLHSQIKNWINEDPSLANIEHSMEHPNPNFKAVRYFIAVEDNIDGQDFILNNKKWIWKKGDCIKLNVWTTEHHTANNSHVDRYMLKITAIENR